jgi:hypothetical protein
VTTTGPSAALHSDFETTSLYVLWMPMLGVVGAGVGLRARQQKSKGRFLEVLLSAALLSCLAAELACSGSNNSNGGGGGGSRSTPSGTYTITVTGTFGSLQHSTTTTLKVQ